METLLMPFVWLVCYPKVFAAWGLLAIVALGIRSALKGGLNNEQP